MERKLAAILAADVVGYSRLMEDDEADTLRRLQALMQELVQPCIAKHSGRTVKLMGDGVLAEFPSVVAAVQCAVVMQESLRDREAAFHDEHRLKLRIGVNLGDIMVEGEDIFGEGVNIAARLETLSKPGGICISGKVHEEVAHRLDLVYEDLGEQEVKNISRPIRAYAVRLDETDGIGAQTARSNGADRGFLKRTAAFVVASTLLVLAVSGTIWWQPWQSTNGPGSFSETPSPPADKASIAVLPFANLSGDAEQAYFADGLTDDLITDLSKISDLFVIARNSVFAYQDRDIDVRDVARELGVRYILEGSVRRAGDAVRINAQLIDCLSGAHLWAERYDRPYADIFAIQDQVIERIVLELSIQLTDQERIEVERLPTDNLEAYDYYLRAERLAYRTEQGMVEAALESYERAFVLDPEFAEAYAGYARVAVDALAYAFVNTLPSAVARKRAYEAASQALSINPQLSRGYSVLALLQSIEYEHETAVSSARHAVELSPGNAEAHLNLAVVLLHAGYKSEALEVMGIVLRLNPRPPAYVQDYHALTLFMNERYEEALGALEHQLDEIRSDLALEVQASVSARLGRNETAQEAVEEILKRWPQQSLAFYRVIFSHYAREEDRSERLDSLQLAGMPEWPYGFEGDPQFQLRGEEIDALLSGTTWTGERIGFGTFIQYMQANGDFIERGPGYQIVGTFSRIDDMLCLQSAAVVLGRKNCGPIYRNPSGTVEEQNEYAHINSYELKNFSVDP